MANPFRTKFKSQCQSCGKKIPQGEEMFAHGGMFICEEEAEREDVICDCGNYKKAEYPTCFVCKDLKEDLSRQEDAIPH